MKYFVRITMFTVMCAAFYLTLRINYSVRFALCWAPIIVYTLGILVDIKEGFKK